MDCIRTMMPEPDCPSLSCSATDLPFESGAREYSLWVEKVLSWRLPSFAGVDFIVAHRFRWWQENALLSEVEAVWRQLRKAVVSGTRTRNARAKRPI